MRYLLPLACALLLLPANAHAATSAQNEVPKPIACEGVDLVDKGNYGEAVIELTRYIDANPSDWRAYEWRALAHNWLCNHELALADYDQAIELKPGYFRLYAKRARTYLSLGRLSDAELDLKRVMDLAPHDHSVAYLQAWFLMKAKKYEESAEVCRKSISEDPNHPLNYEYLALSMLELGKYDDAIAAICRGLIVAKGLKWRPLECKRLYNTRATILLRIAQHDQEMIWKIAGEPTPPAQDKH